MHNEHILNEISVPLLYWYAASARDLPWRRDVTPYHVWISEIMLQQTRVEAVKGYYERFLAAFPTVADLAAADDDVLNKVWQGLGYYSRARNLKKAAIIMMEQYGGELPRDHAALLSLPGIGAYTAGAIASIALGQPTPAVDGNVLRVVTRLCACYDDIAKQTTKDDVTAALEGVYPRTPHEASAFTQSLMELGATVCVPNGAPHCADCPVRDLCLAYKKGITDVLPVKAPKKARTAVDRTVLLLRLGKRWAICKRPDTGLLAGLWEFPSFDGQMAENDVLAYLRTQGIAVGGIRKTPPAKHIFTHIEWHMTGWICEISCEAAQLPFTFVTPEDIRETYSIPSAYKAFLHIIL